MSLITVGICTYKRPEFLKICVSSVVDSIKRSAMEGFFEVVVIDNDSNCSASPVLQYFEQFDISIRYISEKSKGISNARNAALNDCKTRYICFVDDDEYVCKDWAFLFLSAVKNIDAVVILAPVVPIYPAGTADYIIQSKIFERPRFLTGTKVRKGGTGNTLIDLSFVKKNKISFDINFGLTGGEDSRFFEDVQCAGGVMKWLDEAIAYEPVAQERISLSYIAQRALRGGQTHVDIHVKGFLSKAINFCIRIIEVISLILPIIILWFINKRMFLTLHRRLFAAFGQLLATFNKKFEMY